MASLHLARTTTSAGGARLVVVKRLRRERTFDKDSVAILSEEARLNARVQHANVIGMLDLAIIDGALGLVLEHVVGETLVMLAARSAELHEFVPPAISATIMRDVLRGLQAAHEARSDDGAPLPIAHGDVSPSKIFVGTDGKARLTDFSAAIAREGREWPRLDELLGNFAYMPPEQLLGSPVTEKGDLYAVGVVLWELLAGRTLFVREDVEATRSAVLAGVTTPPSAYNRAVPPELDAIVMRAIAPQAYSRYATAGEFAAALEPWCRADERVVGAWVSKLAADQLAAMQSFLRSVGFVAEERSVASHVSIPGVERPTEGQGPTEGVFERTTRKLFAYTPFAPPSDMRRFQQFLVAGGVLVVLAFFLFGGTSRSEPEATFEEPAAEEPMLAAPAPLPAPEPAPTIATAIPEPMAPPVPTAEPAATATAIAPTAKKVPATASPSAPVSQASASASLSSTPRPVRRQKTPASTSTTPPVAASAAPSAPVDPGSLKDYR